MFFSELEESLLVMPFSYTTQLLPLLDEFIKHGWEVELSCRCLFFLLRIHHGQITSNQSLLPIVDRLRTNTEMMVENLRVSTKHTRQGVMYDFIGKKTVAGFLND